MSVSELGLLLLTAQVTRTNRHEVDRVVPIIVHSLKSMICFLTFAVCYIGCMTEREARFCQLSTIPS